MRYDAVIIGAGVTGSLIARELTKTDASVLVVDKASDVSMGTTKANSAIVHAGFDAKTGTLKAKLNVRGAEMMEKLCRDLGVKYKRNGALVVGFSAEDRKTLEALRERGEANGVQGLAVYSKEEFPGEKTFLGEAVTDVLYAPASAIVCPYELCIAAMGNALDNGASLRLNTEVTALRKNDDGYDVTVQERNGAAETISARLVINAAGVYADQIARMAGDDSFTITPRRGEYLLLDKDEGGRTPYTVFRCPSRMGKGVLVTPTVDGNLLIGPTAEDQEDRGAVPTTAEGLADVRKKAAEQVQGIDFSKVITSFAGLRATGSTGDFVIERNGSFVNVAAIESPGLSSAPAIAEYVASLVSDVFPAVKRTAAAYAPAEKEPGVFYERKKPLHWFRELTAEEKNAVIRENPAYGHVVCRCEGITEGEIIEAIRTAPGAADLDGVKRRTRSGMGRCQGGFCAPLVLEILARERGIERTAVTKSGGLSVINQQTIKEDK